MSAALMTLTWKSNSIGETAKDGPDQNAVTVGRAWRVTNQLNPKRGQFQACTYYGTVEHDLGSFATMDTAKAAIEKALAEPLIQTAPAT